MLRDHLASPTSRAERCSASGAARRRFARHAFNELISFIAGWAILIDYLIVIAAAAITVSHYSDADLVGPSRRGDVELGGRRAGDRARRDPQHRATSPAANRQRRLVVLALAELGLQLPVIVVGLLVVLHPDRLTDQLDLFSSPTRQATSSTRWWSRRSPTRGSRPPATWHPSSSSSRAT